MTRKYFRRRWMVMYLSAGAILPQFAGCPLSDQQLASILQTVLTTALTTAVNTAITAAGAA